MMTSRPASTLRILVEAALVSVIFAALLGFSTYLLYQKSLLALENEIKLGLLSSVRAAATTVDGDIHQTFDATTPLTDPDYQRVGSGLERIRQHSQDIRYIYTTVMAGGQIRFVVNLSPQNDMDNDGEPDPPPALMVEYKDAPPELIKALSDFQPSVTDEPYRDQWGSFISAYAPITGSDGRPVGVLAMDLELSSFYQRLAPIHQVFGKALFIIAFLSLATGLLVYGLRTRGARRLAGLLEWRQHAAVLERYAEEKQVWQLQDRAVPWCLLFGGASPTVLPTPVADIARPDAAGETCQLGTWLFENSDVLKPTSGSSVVNSLPTDCAVHADTVAWRDFWVETTKLWQDCMQVSICTEFVVIDELLEQWLIGCRISALPGEGERQGLVPGEGFWRSFLNWQAHAAALGVTVHQVDRGRIDLRFTMAKFAMSDGKAAA